MCAISHITLILVILNMFEVLRLFIYKYFLTEGHRSTKQDFEHGGRKGNDKNKNPEAPAKGL